MQKILFAFRKKVLPNAALLVFVGATMVTSSAAAYKLSQSQAVQKMAGKSETAITDNKNPSRGLTETSEKSDDGLTDNRSAENSQEPENFQASNGPANNSQTNITTSSTGGTMLDNLVNANPILNSGQNIANNNTPVATTIAADFSAQTLALHNKPGDCYIAYSGKVYDLSNVAAWAGCTHHGYTGGVDVTASFPHPTSYLASLPVKGTYSASGSITVTVPGSNNSNTGSGNSSNSSNPAITPAPASNIRRDDDGDNDRGELEHRNSTSRWSEDD